MSKICGGRGEYLYNHGTVCHIPAVLAQKAVDGLEATRIYRSLLSLVRKSSILNLITIYYDFLFFKYQE